MPPMKYPVPPYGSKIAVFDLLKTKFINIEKLQWDHNHGPNTYKRIATNISSFE